MAALNDMLVSVRFDVGARAILALGSVVRLASGRLKKGETSKDRLAAVALYAAGEMSRLEALAADKPDPDPGDADQPRRRPVPPGFRLTK